jgi:branched-chain amino acid transport system substrate-binding protein
LTVTNRTAFNDNIQGVVVARFIQSVLGATKIAVLHDNSSYGEGLANTVQTTFAELGGEVVAFEAIDADEQDYRTQLTVLAGLEPEVVYFGGYDPQAALLVAQMKEVGLENAIFFSDDGVYNQTFLDVAAENAEGSYVSFGSQSGSEEANAEFDAAYEETFGVAPDEMGPFHAQAYDAAKVILAAMEAVATTDADGNLVIDREALIEAVRATSGHEGLSGVITCDENGDCGTAEIGVLVAEGGEWVAVDVPAELQVAAE